jgi:hypothetical protein
LSVNYRFHNNKVQRRKKYDCERQILISFKFKIILTTKMVLHGLNQPNCNRF